MSAFEESRAEIAAGRSCWSGPRLWSLTFSLALHFAAAFILLWFSDAGNAIGEPALNERLIERQRDRIVWYHLKEIPTISPEKPREADRIRTERVNPNVIIHDSPEAARDDRLVWRLPDNKARSQKTPVTDMIAVARGADAAATPEYPVETKSAPIPAKPIPKLFVAPAAPPPAAATAQIRLEEPPPSLNPPKLAIPDASLSALTAGGKVKYSKRFIPPPPATRAAPGEAGSGNILPDAPTLPGSGGASDISALIVNAVPVGAINAAPPRQSAMSVGPVIGAPNDNGSRSGIQIGAVTVIPGTGKAETVEASLDSPKDPKKRPIESTTVTQPYVTTRIAPLEHTVSAPLPPSSRNLPERIEARFRGRTVYTMLFPMKGLPGYVGDWTIWFAERQYADGGGSRAPMRAPLPIRKPVRIGTALAVSPGEVRLSATMSKTGKIDSVAMIEGSMSTADAAIEDLESWEFLPALSNLEPVDIDLIVEIPFGINPKSLPRAKVPVLTEVDRSPQTSHN